ncbi:hypothetical protein H6F67_17005 [Microcoleus sp. FACHB-1515]|uniref:hypothetical protein n=1 Tax=Cyanophyceae TaxID=3028117 RepID=UPI001685DA55|nr:hypothetical protein [Microcoleus sp. FACHB-1515]MBD2091544.1 hypothetical protein [Microcoleus sp. FACHB-1515]
MRKPGFLLLRSIFVFTLLLSSCDRLRFVQQQAEARFTIRVSGSTPGIYAVDGTANLPDGTKINVIALRYLKPGNAASAKLNPNPTYSILAYQSVEVKQGEWQSDLNLWRIARDGRLQENWQQEQERLGITFAPDEQVLFLATLDPIENLSQLEQDLKAQNLQLAKGAIRTGRDGLRFAQVDYLMAIVPPTGRTAPPPIDPNTENGGWGRRYLIPQEPQNPTPIENPTERQTNAPSRPEEFLQ